MVTAKDPTRRPYSAMADALPNQICALDATGRVAFTNAAWHQFAADNGYCGAPFIGVNYLAVCEQADGAEMGDARRVGRGLRAVLTGELELFEHVYPCHAPDTTRWFRMQAVPFDGGLLIIHVPASDPARAEAELTDILSHIAHELRTPLGAIAGYSDLLAATRQTATPEQQASYTQTIRQSSLYLSGVIEDMMELARSKRGDDVLALNDAPCDLPALIDAAAGMVHALAGERGISLSIDIEETSAGLPTVLADQRRLTQVLVNLLSNAVKFSPRGSAIICRLRTTRSGAARMEIIDHGPGMTADEIPLAFSPYGRTASARGSGATGLGLGLPLSKALVELHGGSLTLDSRPSQGTTAAISLPAWRCIRPDQASTAEPQRREA